MTEKLIEVEVAKPFTYCYPVAGDATPDFIQDQLVPGSDGYLVKRPVAYRRIVGTVDYTREEAGEVKVISHGCGPLRIPVEHARHLSEKGLVKLLAELPPAAGEPSPPPRGARNRPTPVAA